MSAKQPKIIQRAKQLRVDMTKPEDKLWWHLRDQKPALGKFRRQEPIDFFVADFVSYEHRLVIELDGSNHIPEKDVQRDKYLESHNFKVLRFTNQDVMQNIQMVLDNIHLAVANPPPPRLSAGRTRPAEPVPLPQGEGEFTQAVKSTRKNEE